MIYHPQTKEELMQIALEDPRYIIESGFYVINKDRQIKPFKFNNLQNEYYDTIWLPDRKARRPNRDDIVKGSQLGFSTVIEAILTVFFLMAPNSWNVTISHEAEATKRLFEKVDFFLKTMEAWLRPFYLPDELSTKELGNKVMNSKFYIGTAGARAFGRGDTIHNAHLSELSRWKDSGKIATGILRAVPANNPYTYIVKETTANGQGNYHHVEWKREKAGLSEFKPYFALWLKDETYKVTGAKIDKYTHEELYYKRLYPDLMTDERIAFRRKMIGTLGSEDGRPPEDMFKQEFPLTEDEAFLFSGNPVFSQEKLKEYETEAPKPIIRGNLVGISPNETIEETDRGWLRLFDMPEVGGQYIIFGDTAQVHDGCSAHVVDKKTWREMAHFHGRITAHHFGDELNKLGHFFNDALIAVEVNNMGQSTIDRLKDLNYPYLYMRERLNVQEKTVTKEYGWATTAKSKPLMIGHLQDLIRTKQIPFIDRETISELVTFILTATGSMEASEGNYDDRVISLAGVYYILKLNPFVDTAPKKTTVENKVKKFKAFRAGKKRWR